MYFSGINTTNIINALASKYMKFYFLDLLGTVEFCVELFLCTAKFDANYA